LKEDADSDTDYESDAEGTEVTWEMFLNSDQDDNDGVEVTGPSQAECSEVAPETEPTAVVQPTSAVQAAPRDAAGTTSIATTSTNVDIPESTDATA
jgi:hypothetical protein